MAVCRPSMAAVANAAAELLLQLQRELAARADAIAPSAGLARRVRACVRAWCACVRACVRACMMCVCVCVLCVCVCACVVGCAWCEAVCVSWLQEEPTPRAAPAVATL
jgi:hypothetical protein